MNPLAGLRVIEFTQVAAGPFAGSLLADLGADVVKVENPDGGDGMRQWPPLMDGESGPRFSGNFASVNRNKRSIMADLKDPAQRRRLQDLSAEADVFLENFRPGVMQRLGLGYEELKTRNPRLVYCSITGYGQTGPYAQKGAFDITVQALSGLMSVTGEEDGPPVKCGVPVGDFTAGLYAAYTILAAVLRARETGEGAVIDCSMLGSLLGVSALQTSQYFGTGRAPDRLGSAHPRNAPYQGFQASDVPFVVAAGNDKLWRDLCELVGRPELPADERFRTQSLRAENQKQLAATLQPIFATQPAKEWALGARRQGHPVCADKRLRRRAGGSTGRAHGIGAARATTQFGNDANGRVSDQYQRLPIRDRAPAAGAWAAQRRGIRGMVASDSAAPLLIVEKDPSRGVQKITLNRTGKGNALDATIVDELTQALERCYADGTKILVLAGAGKNFCSGFDFTGYEQQSAGALLDRFVRIELILQLVRRAPCVTVATITGAVFGAGADLAAACTYRLADSGARFRFPGFRFGVALGTRHLARLVGAQEARNILLRNSTVDANQAAAIGLLTHVLDPVQQDEFIDATLSAMASLDSQAAADILRLTAEETDDRDLADLVRSVARPGLHERMARYRQAHA